MTHNVNQINQFFDFLNHNEYTLFQGFLVDPVNSNHEVIRDRAAYPTRSYFVKTKEEAIDLCKKYEKRGVLCFGINQREKGVTRIDQGFKKLNLILFDVDIESRDRGLASENLIWNECNQKVNEINEYLEDLGFTIDYISYTGNGFHIGIKVNINIPDYNSLESWKSTEVYKRLVHLEKQLKNEFDNENIKIDSITKDLARRVKIPGTFNVKRYKNQNDQYEIIPEFRKSEILFLNENINEKNNNAAFFNLEIGNTRNRIIKRAVSFSYLLEKDEKLKNLFNGNITGYKSRSEAEIALLHKLIYYHLPKSKIYEIMERSEIGKWSGSPDQYKDLTYNNAIKTNTTKKTKNKNKKTKLDYFQISLDLKKKYHIYKPRQYRNTILAYIDGYYQERDENLYLDMVITRYFEKKKLTDYLKISGYNIIKKIILSKSVCDLNQFGNKSYLNVKNGLIDLTKLPKIKFIDHTPLIKSVVRIPVNFNPFCRNPKIDHFITQIVGDQKGNIYKLLSDAISRDIKHQRAFLLVGSGSNGKSTLLELFVRVLGRENCTKKSLHKLTTDKFSIGGLQGKLLNIFDDLPKTKLGDVSSFKIAVTERYLEGERKFENTFTFENTCTHVFATNRVPEADDDSKAFFRRWIPINCTLQINENEKNENILNEICTNNEMSGLLNQILIHFVDLKENGYAVMENEDIQRWWIQNSNPIVFYVNHNFEVEPMSKVDRDQVLHEYNEWCRENGYETTTKYTLTSTITQHFEVTTRTTTKNYQKVTYYVGLKRIINEIEDLKEIRPPDSRTLGRGKFNVRRDHLK